MVDWVLPVADMPARILSYNANETRLNLPPEDGPQPAKPANPPDDEAEANLREVLVFLRMRTGNDFTYYKRATILRRIARRMQVNGVGTLPEYLLTLRTHAGEAAALLQDLLISVTNFFRDREAFAAIEARIPTLFAGKGPEDTVRVWCAACATGEEPYSMAMLLLEHARKLAHPPTVQVFGCDLDAESIKTARAGVYPSAISADVSEERIARFFVKEPRGYQVRRELRETVLFAEHDLLKDAPFSRLDLVSCRNLLIYLEREAQARAMEIFHFALKPDGLLFLGSAESVDEERGLFTLLDKKHRLYVRRPVAHVGLPVPMGTGTLLRALQAQSKEAPVLPGPAFHRGTTPSFAPTPFPSPSDERAALADLHFRLIERYAPPSVIVNAEGDIVHLSENAGRFLRPSGGQPTANLLRTVHPDLRMDLHTALLRVAETDAPVEGFGARIEMEGHARMVDLRVAPAAELAPGYVLVSFAAREPDLEAVAEIAVAARPEAEAVVRHLERELEQARGRLRDTIERAGATEEEYKSSNEELQSMNEELRSASEELETSREELQSINEELSTVNLQLKHNVEELAHANSDLHNLMNATSIATVFLDRELRVMRYTPEAVAIFHLIPSDMGRPLADLKQRIDYFGMDADARQVLRTLVPMEREVGDGGGVGWFLARIAPYRSLEERIEGVVLTFVDITERRRAEEDRRESEEKYRTLFNSMDEGYCIIQMLHDAGGKPVDWRYLDVNPAFEKHNGLHNATGRTIRELALDIEEKWMEIYGRVAASGESMRFEESSPALDGRTFDLYAFRVGAPAERKLAVLFTDITGRKQGETQQAFLLQLNDALRAHSDAVEIQAAVTGIVMDHFGANRCYYGEIEDNKAIIRRDASRGDLPSVAGVYPLDDFPLFKTMMRGGVPLVVPDASVTNLMDEELRQLCLQMRIDSFVNVPVIKNNRYAGNLCITQSTPRKWMDSEVELAKEIAERTWAAVERARAEAALRTSAEQQAFLLGLSDALRSLDDPLEIQQAAMRMLGERLDATRAFYFLTEPEEDNWIHVIETDYRRDPGVPSHVGRYSVKDYGSSLFEGMEHGKILVVSDVARAPGLTAAEVQSYRAIDIAAFVLAPLVWNGQFVAGIGVHDSAPHDWKAEDLTLIQEVASRIWTAVERARATKALHASEAQLAVELADTRQLHRISSALVEGDNDDALYAQILDAACAVMHSDLASLQIFVPERNALRLLAHNGFAPESAKHWEWVRLDDTSSCGQAMTEEHRIIVSDAERWEFVAGTEDLAHYRLSGIRAVQSTRLVSRNGRLVGMISTHWRDVHQPSERELRLFDVLVRQAADLIERRTAQEALRESEEKFRTLTNAAPALIWQNDARGENLFINQRYIDFVGMTAEQINGAGWHTLVHLDDREAYVADYLAAVRDHRAWNNQNRIRRHDGEWRWFDNYAQPLFDAGGAYLGHVGASVDITERRQAEDALVESTARLRTAVSLAGLGTCQWDWSTHEMRGNDQRFLMCGLDPAAGVIPEEQYRVMLHSGDRDTVWPRILRDLEEHGEYAAEYRFILPDGIVRWLSEAGRVIDRQPDGRPWHVESALFDITTHREAEAAIAESELRFRTLANALPQVIWTNDTDGNANYFNQGWYEYTGLTYEQSHGPGWQAVAHPDDLPASREKWDYALEAGIVFETEYRLRRADGEYRWHLGRNVPLKDEAGRVLGWFGSATDIHDLKEAERETEHARAAVEAAGQAKDHFLAVLSHELRTPLMPITMALAVLARRPDLPEAVTRTFAMIQRNVELEARFIDDLLDVTRIERGKMEIARADINLYEAIERAVEVSMPDIEARGQRLTVALEGSACPYHGDPARLQQVFWNLLKNASKFTPPGGAIEIRSSCRIGDQVVVEVIDTGIGLEADTIERIFRPFEQASVTITREFGGLGLGLAIAKATVDAHGGTLRVASPGLGQGATFTVSLPVPSTAGTTA